MGTYNLTRDQYNATWEKVQKANLRATRKGLSGFLTIEGHAKMVTKVDEITGIDRSYEVIETTLGGEPPKYDGWTFLATLSWDEGGAGLVVRTAPGVTTVDREGLTEGQCDHCKTNRYRNDTFLLRHDDGRQVQVGSTCIKDFLGIQVGIAWLDEQTIADSFGEGAGYGNSPIDHGVEYVLALAWALIKLDGYKPSSNWAGTGTTKSDVLNILYPPRPVTETYRVWASRVRELAAEAVERAAEIRAFILSSNFAGDSEYVRNLKVITGGEKVSDKNIGYLVSAPQAWMRYLEKKTTQEAQEAKVPSEHVGRVGDKLTLKVTVKSIKFHTDNYGTTVIYTMMDDYGNVFTWFSSRGTLGDAVGDEHTIKGTVKKHTEFAGVRQTQLTRCTLVEEK